MNWRSSSRASDYRLLPGAALIMGLCCSFLAVPTASAGFTSAHAGRYCSPEQQFKQDERSAILVSSAGGTQLGASNSLSISNSLSGAESRVSSRVQSDAPSWSETIRSLFLDKLEATSVVWDLLWATDSFPETPPETPWPNWMVAGVLSGVPQNDKSESVHPSLFGFLNGNAVAPSFAAVISSERKPSAVVRHLIRGRATETIGDFQLELINAIQTNTTPACLKGAGVFSFFSSAGMPRRVFKATGSSGESRRVVGSVLCFPRAACPVASTEFFVPSYHLKGEWI